jgi:hypothetical protein
VLVWQSVLAFPLFIDFSSLISDVHSSCIRLGRDVCCPVLAVCVKSCSRARVLLRKLEGEGSLTITSTGNDSFTQCYFESPGIRANGRSVSVALWLT